MVKKLIRIATLAFLLMLSIGHCEMLSLGEISVKSGLDQKLKAYIQVNNFPKDSNNVSWQVSGDEMGKALSGLKYALETKDNMASLQVTSQQPIHSPVLTLNVLANDGKEQVAASEYTILLDPVTKPVPVDVKQYGPIARGEELSQVAEKVKPNYITVDNAANALFYANPHAFENNDSSKLIPGSFLVIPEFSPGVSTLGQNSINEKRFDDIEEQLGLITVNVAKTDSESKQRFDELSAYTLQLETLVTKLDARVANLEGKTAFMSDDLNQLSKKQETSARQASTRISKNTSLIKQLEAELTQRWYYLIGAIVLIILCIMIFLWWKKRRQASEGEEIILDDYPEPKPVKDDSSTVAKQEDNLETEPSKQDEEIILEQNEESDSDEQITSEVIKEPEAASEEDLVKDEEYHRHFIQDDQDEKGVFVDPTDEEELKKAIEQDDGEEDEDSDSDEEITNATEEVSSVNEVNIVLDDEDDSYDINDSLDPLEGKEATESDVNEFELNEDEIQNASLDDLAKALESKVKSSSNENKSKDFELENSEVQNNEETESSDDEITSETPIYNEEKKESKDNVHKESESESKNASDGLKLAPLDLTNKTKS